jgi:hypothetical protein
MDKCTPDNHIFPPWGYGTGPSCLCGKMMRKTATPGPSIFGVPIRVDPSMPPGQMMLLNDKYMKFSSTAPVLCKLRYRLRWWQIWRPKHIWLVVRPSALSFSYEAEVYDKRKPEHRKLMAELGKPGFTAINFKGIPMAPDNPASGKVFRFGDDTPLRREGNLMAVPEVPTDSEGYGWGQVPGKKTLTPAESATLMAVGDAVEKLYQPRTPKHYRRPASKSRKKKK